LLSQEKQIRALESYSRDLERQLNHASKELAQCIGERPTLIRNWAPANWEKTVARLDSLERERGAYE
jgi:hypothetical protein